MTCSNRLPALILLALLAIAPAPCARAEIVIDGVEHEVYAPIVAAAVYQADDDDEVLLKWNSDCTIKDLGNDQVVIAGPPCQLDEDGEPIPHWVEFRAEILRLRTYRVNDTDGNPVEIRAYEGRETVTDRVEFVITGDAPTPGPIGPEPLPKPSPGSLGALAGSDAVRRQLHEFFAAFSATVGSGTVRSTGHFRSAYQVAVTTFKASGKLPSMSAIDKPISDKIAAAVGLEDAPLVGQKRNALQSVLAHIALEFVGGP